jgi:hypothetical protein
VAQKTASKASGKGRTTNRSTKKSGDSRSTKPGTTRRRPLEAAAATGDETVSIDRRRSASRRDEQKSGDDSSASAPQMERRKKVNRRRQIDPTTCERDYTEEEVAFMNALDDYKRRSGRMFPTCSEVLEVVRELGYVKLSPAEMGGMGASTPTFSSAKPMPMEGPESGVAMPLPGVESPAATDAAETA